MFEYYDVKDLHICGGEYPGLIQGSGDNQENTKKADIPIVSWLKFLAIPIYPSHLKEKVFCWECP